MTMQRLHIAEQILSFLPSLLQRTRYEQHTAVPGNGVTWLQRSKVRIGVNAGKRAPLVGLEMMRRFPGCRQYRRAIRRYDADDPVIAIVFGEAPFFDVTLGPLDLLLALDEAHTIDIATTTRFLSVVGGKFAAAAKVGPRPVLVGKRRAGPQ